MTNDYRFLLETPRVTGRRQQKFECPQCGKRKCFVRYVDTHDGCRYVADHVGKCDHEHSCGYHMKPGEYFRDNPRSGDADSRGGRRFTPPPLPPFSPLPMEYVLRSHSPRSTFWRWFSTEVAARLALSDGDVRRVFGDYMVGATRSGNVIFWQIDGQGRVHGGHVMQYGADGHRHGFQGWTHVPLIRQGRLPLDWQLYQCLFGEHLLTRYPDRHVCVVESEKTALLMSACQPRHVWLATAGSGGLSREKLECLRGRRVTLFPDSGCHAKWSERMSLTTGIDYNVSAHLEGFPPNTDLGDVLLAQPP